MTKEIGLPRFDRLTLVNWVQATAGFGGFHAGLNTSEALLVGNSARPPRVPGRRVRRTLGRSLSEQQYVKFHPFALHQRPEYCHAHHVVDLWLYIYIYLVQVITKVAIYGLRTIPGNALTLVFCIRQRSSVAIDHSHIYIYACLKPITPSSTSHYTSVHTVFAIKASLLPNIAQHRMTAEATYVRGNPCEPVSMKRMLS